MIRAFRISFTDPKSLSPRTGTGPRTGQPNSADSNCADSNSADSNLAEQRGGKADPGFSQARDLARLTTTGISFDPRAFVQAAFGLILFLLAGNQAFANDVELIEVKHRAGQLGTTFQVLNAAPYDGMGRTGGGIYGVYEFLLNSRFSLGLQLALRQYPGQVGMQQVGYGLLFRHRFEQRTSFTPFLEYGLLMQISRIADRSSSATSHDTRLAGGTEFNGFGQTWLVALAYHISPLRFFNTENKDLDYSEVSMGWRTTW